MKTSKKILVAFLLNLSFSIFEIIGGIFTNSIAIISDAIHDFGDSLSIGISYFLERKSKRKPDTKYTYGYSRYSILGAFITNSILIAGSLLVIYNAINRIIKPTEINYDGMIVFALIGVIVNFIAVYYTRDGKSLNQRAINLHMLEDVMGWIVVLIGSIVIKFSEVTIIDSILSIFVALFIMFHAIKSFKQILELFLIKIPSSIKIEELKDNLLKINGVIDVHHIHIWSLDGVNNCATMHVIINEKKDNKIKKIIKDVMKVHGITHTTIEVEDSDTKCHDVECIVEDHDTHHHHHH